MMSYALVIAVAGIIAVVVGMFQVSDRHRKAEEDELDWKENNGLPTQGTP